MLSQKLFYFRRLFSIDFVLCVSSFRSLFDLSLSGPLILI